MSLAAPLTPCSSPPLALSASLPPQVPLRRRSARGGDRAAHPGASQPRPQAARRPPRRQGEGRRPRRRGYPAFSRPPASPSFPLAVVERCHPLPGHLRGPHGVPRRPPRAPPRLAPLRRRRPGRHTQVRPCLLALPPPPSPLPSRSRPPPVSPAAPFPPPPQRPDRGPRHAAPQPPPPARRDPPQSQAPALQDHPHGPAPPPRYVLHVPPLLRELALTPFPLPRTEQRSDIASLGRGLRPWRCPHALPAAGPLQSPRDLSSPAEQGGGHRHAGPPLPPLLLTLVCRDSLPPLPPRSSSSTDPIFSWTWTPSKSGTHASWS